MIAQLSKREIEKILPIFNARVCVQYPANAHVYDSGQHVYVREYGVQVSLLDGYADDANHRGGAMCMGNS